MQKTNYKKIKRERRHKKIRSKIKGTKEMPRLAVFRSNKAIHAQIIDDVLGKTLAYVSTLSIKKGTVMEKAKEAGKDMAKKALEKGVKKVTFDRGGFLYTGKIKAFAESAREGGLKF